MESYKIIVLASPDNDRVTISIGEGPATPSPLEVIKALETALAVIRHVSGGDL